MSVPFRFLYFRVLKRRRVVDVFSFTWQDELDFFNGRGTLTGVSKDAQAEFSRESLKMHKPNFHGIL